MGVGDSERDITKHVSRTKLLKNAEIVNIFQICLRIQIDTISACVYAKTKKKDDLRLVFTRTQAMQHLYIVKQI